MLAVKLHKLPQPWLGKRSFLVPIVTWDTARIHIKRWLRTLTVNARTCYPNNSIRFITLVKIPDEHSVCVYRCWAEHMFGPPVYVPMKKVSQRLLEAIGDGPGQFGGVCHPELILGEALPSRCIKWTKDLRKLYSRPRSSSRDI